MDVTKFNWNKEIPLVEDLLEKNVIINRVDETTLEPRLQFCEGFTAEDYGLYFDNQFIAYTVLEEEITPVEFLGVIPELRGNRLGYHLEWKLDGTTIISVEDMNKDKAIKKWNRWVRGVKNAILA